MRTKYQPQSTHFYSPATSTSYSDRFFKPHVSFEIATERYILRTLNRFVDIYDATKLRSEIFFEEYSVARLANSIDFDRYDLHADHLGLFERSTNRLIGTYRVLCSDFTNDFYSESEFHLDEVLNLPGTKLELGRACIAPNHRNGHTLRLLWRGILHYAQKTQARYLFGCSSIHSTCANQAKGLSQALSLDGKILPYASIEPKNRFRFKTPSFDQAQPDESMPILMPSPLLQLYLKFGARIAFEPAYDAEFNCMDYFTWIDLQEIPTAYEKFIAKKVL